MKNIHLFSHGVTTLVVEVLSRDAAGQATCRVVRNVYPPGRKGPEFWRAQHDQPSPGAELVIPSSELRPCRFNVQLRTGHTARRPVNLKPLIVGLLCVLGYWYAGYLRLPELSVNHADAVTEQLLRQTESANAELELRQDFAHKHLDTASWKKWSRAYYESGRNDNDLVNDLNWSGGPIRRSRVSDPESDN